MLDKIFLEQSIHKSFSKLVIPSIISYLFSSIYIIIDGMFVGYFIGTDALAAVNLVLPALMILFSVSNMVATGASVVISNSLGKKNYIHARNMFTVSIISITILSFIFSFIGIISSDILVSYFVKDLLVKEYTVKYLNVFLYSLPFIMPLFSFDNYLRVCGKSGYSMYVNIIVSILNIFLDWLFIAKWNMELEASAYATVISMFFGAFLLIIPFLKKKLELYFVKPHFNFKELGNVFYNGSSELLNSIVGPVVSIFLNASLLHFGGIKAVASYGIVMYIDTLTLGIIFSVIDSIQPAISYCYSANHKERAKKYFQLSCTVTFVASIFFMCLILLIPEKIANLFSDGNDLSVIEMTITALKFFAPSYLFSWLSIMSSGLFTALEMPKNSLIIMIIRSCILPIIFLLILSNIFGLNGIFALETVVSLVSCIFIAIIYRKTLKKFLF